MMEKQKQFREEMERRGYEVIKLISRNYNGLAIRTSYQDCLKLEREIGMTLKADRIEKSFKYLVYPA